jgi:polyisoprenoid-binding protein YceI
MPVRHLLLAGAVALMPHAAAASWELDRAHTQIVFTVDHLGFSDVTAAFRTMDGEVSFDSDDLEATEVTLVIDAASIDTLWEARDEHIRSADFLDVTNHPEITFVSTGLELTGDETAMLTGELTIRGETNPVAFDAVLNNIGPNPFRPDQQIAGFTLTGEIDRTEWGIDFGSPVIGAVMPVTVNVELVRND